MTLAAILQWV